MSEYWKSTPKYWCKHCSTYVRDTKLEKTNHEATPKHQGNLKRFLRDLHRGHEKDQKDKDRAKNEVARLNGLVSGGGPGAEASSSSSSSFKAPAVARPPVSRPLATPSERKQQLAQLAEMGVAIPDEFLPDLAMAGQWQVTSERVVEEDGEKKPDALALGIRKRVLGEEEEELLEAKKRRWGSTYRSHPGEEDDGGLDALLNNATRKGKEVKRDEQLEIKPEEKGEVKTEGGMEGNDLPSAEETRKDEVIKMEPSDGEAIIAGAIPASDATKEAEAPASTVPGVIFKKRKAKNIRHK